MLPEFGLTGAFWSLSGLVEHPAVGAALRLARVQAGDDPLLQRLRLPGVEEVAVHGERGARGEPRAAPPAVAYVA